MLPKCAKVVKPDEMEINGTAYIESAAGTVRCRSLASSEAAEGTGGAIQQARIIESNDSHAILELICSCGCKSRVQCNYGTV
ncbi:MAG: hypothetical protein ACYTEU_00495 [Planctomycetota bacterium]|jgi:hypothetical protein